MCDQHQHENPVQHLVNEWEHGAMDRREFFQRALMLLGTVGAAEALLSACSPAVVAPTAAPTTAPAAAAPPTSAPTTAPPAVAPPTSAPTTAPPAAAPPTSAPTSAPAAATTAATRPPQPTPPPFTPPAASAVPGYIESPSVVDASDVTYKSGDVTMMAHLAKPKSGSGPWPAIIVIHENRGLNDHIKDVTRRVANLGFVALGIDFLSRLGGTAKFAPPEDPTRAFNQLKQEDVNADIVASVAYLKSRPDVKPKIGITGFCWGGGNALMGAISSPDIAATIMFYGRTPTNPDDVQKVNGPVFANYGETDTFINPGIPALEAAMKKYNKSFEYKVHAGAGHSFFNNTGPSFREAAAKEAWAKLADFFKKNLA